MIERTLIVIKPDAVQRGLVGEIVKRFEQRGIKIAAMKMVHIDEAHARKHYPLTPEQIKLTATKTREGLKAKGIELSETDEQICKRIQDWMVEYMTEGPVVAFVGEGYHAVEMGRKIVGHTEAKQALPGTIRGDYSVDSYALADKKQRLIRNLVHASGSVGEAENEIALWFAKVEIHDYTKKDWEVMH